MVAGWISDGRPQLGMADWALLVNRLLPLALSIVARTLEVSHTQPCLDQEASFAGSAYSCWQSNCVPLRSAPDFFVTGKICIARHFTRYKLVCAAWYRVLVGMHSTFAD